MSWWSTIVDGVQDVTYSLGRGVSWVWNHTPLANIPITLFTYSANTVFEGVKQVLAIRTAIPALLDPENRKIVKGMALLFGRDVVLISGVYYLNRETQKYFYGSEEDRINMSITYSAFLSTLTIVDYGVKALIVHQGIQASARMFVLDSLAPPTFKKVSPAQVKTNESVCEDEECNNKRIMKGFVREPIILTTNEIVTWAMSYIPHYGLPIATVLRVFFNGRYIVRASTKELCERHKLEFVMKESTLAFGLGIEFLSQLIEQQLEASIGLPPFLQLRVLRHLLILLYINLATHVSIPVIKPQQATISNDPLDLYEKGCRFLIDSLIAGIMKRYPIDFQNDGPPIVTLNSCLDYLVQLLNSDLEQEVKPQPTFFKSVAASMKPGVPAIIRDTRGFLSDPIVREHWEELRANLNSTLDAIEQKGKSNAVKGLKKVPQVGLAYLIHFIYGIPQSVVNMILKLSDEKKVWEFINALNYWVRRHDVSGVMTPLPVLPVAPLSGGPLVEVPNKNKSVPLPEPEELLSGKPSDDSVPQLLIAKPATDSITENPDVLFSTYHRRPFKMDETQDDVLVFNQELKS